MVKREYLSQSFAVKKEVLYTEYGIVGVFGLWTSPVVLFYLYRVSLLENFPRRVVVIGSSCDGKTTFASRLAMLLETKHIELDALHWEPNWIEAADTVFRSRVMDALDSSSWVVDGNYTDKIKDVVWSRADTLIWLDPPLSVVLKRFFFRSGTRSFKGELLWGHCRETLKNSIFSRNSLLIWILTTHTRRTKDYKKLVENPPKGATVYRLRKQGQIEDFFSVFWPAPNSGRNTEYR